MASIRVRNGRYQVRWRQDGRPLAETFPDRAQARRFLGLVIAAGERHPDGWVPGHGYPQGAPAGVGGPTLAAWFERAVAARTTANERSKHDMRRDFRLHDRVLMAMIYVQSMALKEIARLLDVTESWVALLHSPVTEPGAGARRRAA
jgi:hypothetical protein